MPCVIEKSQVIHLEWLWKNERHELFAGAV